MRHGDTKTTFATGAQRDTTKGKGQPSLISPVLIHRLGVLLSKGAEHYGADNWTKGMPYRRTADSIIRHIYQWLAGDEEEDHLAAVAFGVMALMTYEDNESLPKSLDDRDQGLKKILNSILTSPTSKPKITDVGSKIVKFNAATEHVCLVCHKVVPLGTVCCHHDTVKIVPRNPMKQALIAQAYVGRGWDCCPCGDKKDVGFAECANCNHKRRTCSTCKNPLDETPMNSGSQCYSCGGFASKGSIECWTCERRRKMK